MILTGPVVLPRPDQVTPINRLLASVLSSVLPSFEVGDPLEVDKITGNKTWQHYISNDPLFWRGGVKARQGQAGLDAIASLNLSNVISPFIVLHGANDEITYKEGIVKLMKEAASFDKQEIEIEGARHHLLLERESLKRKP